MKYKSKVDWWYYAFVLLFTYLTFHVCFGFSVTNNIREHTLLFLLFLLCEFVFLLPNFYLTYYILDDDKIYVRSGYFYCKDIAYEDIVKVRDTKSIFAACGMALERIEITYKYEDSIDSVQISPKDRKRVKEEIESRMKNQDVTDISGFFRNDTQSEDQPLNGIIEQDELKKQYTCHE